MKNDKFQLFLEQNKFESDILKSAVLKQVKVSVTSQRWLFHVVLNNIIEPDLLFSFINNIERYFKVPKVVKKVEVVIEFANIDQFEKYALDFYETILQVQMNDKPSYAVLKNFKTTYDGKFLVWIDKESTYIEPYLEGIVEAFKNVGIDVVVEMVIDETLETASSKLEKSVQEQIAYIEKTEAFDQKQTEQSKVKQVFTRKSKATLVPIKEIPIDTYHLDKYKNEKGDTRFIIKGEVFKLEIRKLTRHTLLTLTLADSEDAIVVKRFLKSKRDFDIAEGLKEGMTIEVEGEAQFDTFQREVIIMASAIYFTEQEEKTERLDKAKEKRIEFHVHTKMSTMDAVTDAKDYIDRAVKWGHPAIAITDHNGLYAYPDIAKASKGKPIKVIYGVELDYVDEENFLITTKSNNNFELRDATYVVFDIETTGLSVTRDKIIEIGAVKVYQGQVIDRFQSFVNPEEKLSSFTQNLTEITDEMVQNAETIDKVLPKFLEFAKGAVLVAHNALFDVGHIRENARKLNLEFNEEYVIDTLSLARYFYSEKVDEETGKKEGLKRFNLKAIAKYFKVELDQHHRADSDALATAQSFILMLQDLSKMQIKTYQDINNAIDVHEAYKHIMPRHVNVLVKNQAGYKSLFKVMSKALTDHFHQGPRTLKSTLEKFRENLLISSGCYRGEVFEAALNQGDDALRKAIQFYDYIEVQPPQAYKHLMSELGENSQAIIEGIISKIIRTSKEFNKIVIASGDVHYLDKSDAMYRDIYIRVPQVGGGLHDLNKYDVMPEVHFLTTDEMLKSFAFLGEDLAKEIVVDNTHKLNNLIEPVKAFPDELYSFKDDAFKEALGIESISEEVKRLVYSKAKSLYGENIHPIIESRIEKELKSIIGNKFGPIYYISHILVKKSLDDGYLVGSRGSVGSSLVATLMEITEVNPLRPHYRCPSGDLTVFKLTPEEILEYGITEAEKALQSHFDDVQSGFDLPHALCPICGQKLVKDGHDIPFETFLGFDGDKVPDIDLNFSGDYQAIAHEYVRTLLGEDYSFRAGTISTVAERNAYGFVKGYLEENNIEARSAQIERLAHHIQGVRRSTGQHPGGIVVVPKTNEIYDVTPIQYPADDVKSPWKTTHFDYHAFESNLLKLDILGHDDPTMIKYLMDYVHEHPDEFDFHRAQDIPLDDPNVYKLFTGTEIIGIKGEEDDVLEGIASFGIPEFGTPFTRQMLKDTKPSTFAGLVKISGLSHGTDVWLKNAQDLVLGRTEFGKVDFADIIGCRDDIMVQLANEGMSPFKAFEIMEFVRKGKPSKDPKKWLEYESEMRNSGVKEWYIWSASQIKYMFPKAHAIAYVIMAMRIAWFKVYKPKVFYSGYFSKRADQFDYESMILGANKIRNKLFELANMNNRTAKDDSLIVVLGIAYEMYKRGIKFLPVDIMKSDATTFIIEPDGLRVPFNVIAGLGTQVALDIIEQRNIKPFTSKKDIRNRTKINKTVFEKLEKYGAFGDLIEENNVIDNGLFAL
jgi:DNA polymerase-3 subunit alpha (Gram-positive type)